MRRLLFASGVVLVAGVLVSLALGASGDVPRGRWVIRDFGTLGGDAAFPSAINERGRIVGYSSSTEDDYGFCGRTER